MVDLRLDVFPLVLLHGSHINFAIEVADVADNRLILHADHMVVRDHVVIAGSGHEDIGLVGSPIHRDDAIAFHSGLQSTNRIHFGYPDLSRERTQCLCAAFAHIAVAARLRRSCLQPSRR